MSWLDQEGFFLTIRALGQHHKVEIDQTRFEEIQQASSNLGHILALEEQWAAVIQNYMELEKGLLDAALRHMVIADYEWHTLHDLQLSFAVRLANLLSSCRAYLDQTAHHLDCLKPDEDDAKAFKAARSHEYDARLGYRFMEAMRNFSQHRGLPLHGSSYAISVQEPDLLQYSVATNIDISLLQGDKHFKQTVLAEISEGKPSVEPLIREYMAGLSAVHVKARKGLEQRAAAWMEVILGAIAQHINSSPDANATGLCAMQLGKGNQWLQTVHLGGEMIERVRVLQKRHGALERVPSSFVSGAPRSPGNKR